MGGGRAVAPPRIGARRHPNGEAAAQRCAARRGVDRPTSLAMAADAAELNEEQQKVYDRQIRVWGVEAQRNLTQSRVLFAGPVTGVAAEIAKNVTLAGVGAVRLGAPGVAADAPAANFLVDAAQRARGGGFSAAQACVETLAAMNPMVSVEAVDSAAVLSSVEEYTAVVATRLSVAEASALAAACRSAGTMLFVVDVRGGYGEAICDLGAKHTFSEPKKEMKDGEELIEWNEATIEYPSLERAFSGPWKDLPRKISPCFGAMRAVGGAEAAAEIGPGGLPADACTAEAAAAAAKTAGFDKQPVLDAAASVMAAAGVELSPVCAVVGGIVAQELVKAVSKKGRTMENAFFFDSEEGRGTFALVQA